MKRLLLLFLALCSQLCAADKPNIVFIISDDHAWTDYGFMGHKQIETPNLDKLAARSALFTRGYVPTALCRPALATFANGMYAHQSHVTGNDPSPLPAEATPKTKGKAKGKGKGPAQESPAYVALREKLIGNFYQHPAIPKLLADQGYLSHQSGKWWEGEPRRAGFTHAMTRGFPNPGGRHGDDGLKIGREGMQPVFDFIDHATAEKKPFFLWYAPFMPHTPHTPPERLFQKYKAKGIESDHVARYYAMVEWFDETCGQLMDRIEQKGLTKNTLFVYVADNGWIQSPNSPGYAPRSKQSANEGGTRQPIMFSWPGVIQPGKRGEQLCSSIDIVPTALAAAGAEAPAKLPGLNLLPVLKSGDPTSRKEVFGETFAHDVANIDKPEDTLLYRWVVDGKWKLLLTYDGKLDRYASSHPRTEKRPQLFNLLADPHEDVNLASKNPEIVQRLAEKLQAWWPVTERQVLTKWTDEPGVWR
ncbi:MAG: sulfatase-like hydrolase/transferase [Verrucomicrobiaceae bacterium]|nr:sulfatase-like hydrolase/transferase [Verrucomicrobiaceae bacterium]